MDDIIGIMICRICIWIKQTSWTPCDCADPKSICFVSVSISKARSHDAERGIRSWRVPQLGLVMLVHLNYLQLSRTGFEVDWIGSGITVWGQFRLGLWRKCARCSPVQHPTSTSTPRGLEPLSQHPPHCRKPSHFTRNADVAHQKTAAVCSLLQVQSSMMIKNGPPGSQGITIYQLTLYTLKAKYLKRTA